ncbi:cysteine-rich motor neuron 1 protein-like [Patiria miniata]|uniref:Cysteine-rich motor neuron 1 protein n=1 Tax=Patiria miniata TaxID=46514 RepID=A0A913Z6X3_PATMI|nr:cysteine-rich motor neuron 1 protein-like [Patiria miniata]
MDFPWMTLHPHPLAFKLARSLSGKLDNQPVTIESHLGGGTTDSQMIPALSLHTLIITSWREYVTHSSRVQYLFGCASLLTDKVTDCSNARCKIVFDITCPADSLKIEPRQPPGECCPQPATCRCDFASCPDMMCGEEYNKVMVRVATGQPGSCCHQYECKPKDVQSLPACSGVVCPSVSTNPTVCPPGTRLIQGGFTPDGCCPTPNRCECVPESCEVPTCWPAFSPKRVATATLELGHCCDTYDCVAVEVMQNCIHEDMLFMEGATWNVGHCRVCTCLNQTAHCEITQACYAEQSLLMCYTDTGLRTPGERWDEDECTSCQCLEGEIRCQTASCITNCLNARRMPGICCPVCEEPTFVTISSVECPKMSCSLQCNHGYKHDGSGCMTCECVEGTPGVLTTVTPPTIVCPALDCALVCPLGLKMDSDGCRICECNTESCPDMMATCPKFCPLGYRKDERGCSLCKCQRKQACPDSEPCDKTCLYGYQSSRNGCLRCKCQNCPTLLDCAKQCTHGLERDDRGCEICKCKGTALPTLRPVTLGSCLTLDGRIHDDSEIWHDGCRECFCHNGKEMCSLIACPVPECNQPTIRQGDCCPTCPDSLDNGSLEPAVSHRVCQSLRGEYYIEGETWNADSCTVCVCHESRVLCSTTACPPLPCNQPVMGEEGCCPVCPDNSLNGSATPDDVRPPSSCQMASGVFFESDASWKEDDCTSCTCQDGEVTCYSQVCTPVECRVPVLKKGQCCPVCMGPTPMSHCEFDGVVYADGETWNLDQCIHCMCDKGKTGCVVPDCPNTSCSNSVIMPGECCPRCPNDTPKHTEKPAVDNNEVLLGNDVDTQLTPIMPNHVLNAIDSSSKTTQENNKSSSNSSKPFPVVPVIFSTLAVFLAICIILIMLLYVTRWRHRLLYQVTKKGAPPPKVIPTKPPPPTATAPSAKTMNVDVKNTNRDSVRDSVRDSIRDSAIFKDNMAAKSHLEVGMDVKRLSDYTNVRPVPV